MKRIFGYLTLVACILSTNALSATKTVTSLPYTSVAANDTLVLAQRVMRSQTTGMTIMHSGVVVKLDNDTVFYGDAGGSGTNGLKVSAPNVKTIGGTFIRKKGPGIESGSNNYACNLASNSYGFTSEQTNFVSDGHDGNTIYVTGVNIFDVKFFGGFWTNNSTSYSSREMYNGAVFWSGSFPAVNPVGKYDVEIVGVTIVNGPGQGIIAKGKFKIANSVMSLDAVNTYWDTVNTGGAIGKSSANPYFILARKCEPGTLIYGNRMIAGTKRGGARGIMYEETMGTKAEPVKIHDNYIVVHNGPDKENPGGVGRGFRARGGDLTFGNFWFYNNIVIGVCDNDPATTAIGKDVVCLNIGYPTNRDTCRVFNNVFRAISLTTNTNCQAASISYGKVTSIIPCPHITENNVFSSSSVILSIVDEYNAAQSNNLVLKNNHYKFDNGNDLGYAGVIFNKKTILSGYSGRTTRNNCILGGIFTDGASENDIHWYGVGGDNEIKFQSPHVFKVMNDINPQPGVNISVANGKGVVVASGQTDSIGEFYAELTYRVRRNLIDSLFTPFKVTATYLGAVIEQTLAISTEDNYTEIMLQLNTAPNKPVLISPANLETAVSVTPTFSWSTFDNDDNLDYHSVYYGKDSSNLVSGTVIHPTTNYTPVNMLEYNTKYFWYVKSVDEGQKTSISTTSSFTTMKKPNTPPTAFFYIPSGTFYADTTISLIACGADDYGISRVTYSYRDKLTNNVVILTDVAVNSTSYCDTIVYNITAKDTVMSELIVTIQDTDGEVVSSNSPVSVKKLNKYYLRGTLRIDGVNKPVEGTVFMEKVD